MSAPNSTSVNGHERNPACWNSALLPLRLVCFLLLLLASGCASYGRVQNQPISAIPSKNVYSLKTWADQAHAGDFTFILTFSGGGTRAAAMAYGVMRELHATEVVVDGQKKRLLDEVDHISSVSGGSFTAAYYGLYGERIFTDFETEFLRKNVQGALKRSLFNPFHWFTRKGRTERSIDYYNKILFHDATFADMMDSKRPMIVINASDLAYGVRFSFIQDYFNLLCSDLQSFPVARAVTASSAVPVVFNPVVVENHSGCPDPVYPDHLLVQARESDEVAQLLKGLESYSDKENREYIHFVDGGITDNIGLRAISDVVAISGGIKRTVVALERKIPKRVVYLTVNASTELRPDMDKTLKQPSMLASMNAMTDVQLHRYNAATVDQVRSDLALWAAELSTPEFTVEPYFIEVNFEQVSDPSLKLFLNKIPTSFNLTDQEVDQLIASAKFLLRADPEYQRLLADLAEDQ